MRRPGRSAAPSLDAIAAANASILSRKGIPVSDATETCWACGYEGIKPEKAHVVAHSHGGDMSPGNFFLLCGHCHREQPDGMPREEQELWLLSAPSVWEWTSDLMQKDLGPIYDECRAAGDIDAYHDWYKSGEAPEAIVKGYESAASYLNVRANVAACARKSFDAFLLKRGGFRASPK